MHTIDWLLNGDASIQYIVKTQLLNQQPPQPNDGYIKKYLKRYDTNTHLWGNGLYGPKWISSTYTLLDLINLYASPDSRMKNGYNYLREGIIQKYSLNPDNGQTLDLCIVGMIIRIGSYVKTAETDLKPLIDFVLHTRHTDGAWNCYFNYRRYQTSSLHTTINILEGLLEYTAQGYQYRIDEVHAAMKTANEFLLQKHLFRSRRTKEIIHPRFTKVHFPTRWFYDMGRALEYFAQSHAPYDSRMDEALSMLKGQLQKGPLPKGQTYAGLHHFKYDLDDYKRINTIRALIIMRTYDSDFYESVIRNQSFVK